MVPPVATEPQHDESLTTPLVNKLAKVSFNPFYSNVPPTEANDNYEYPQYKVRPVDYPLLTHAWLIGYNVAPLQPSWPKVDWEPLTEFTHTDVGLRADREKKALLSAASKVDHLSPAIGTKLEGLDLRKLTNTQKDEL